MLRKSSYHGQFYPSDPSLLSAEIATYLTNIKTNKEISRPRAVLVPHAGYMYSGQCAAYAYAQLARFAYKRIIIVAPAHSLPDFVFSVGDYTRLATPLGKLATDDETIRHLLSMPDFVFRQIAHEQEHSIEVQFPFIYHTMPEAKIVPILIGRQSPAASQGLADDLASFSADFWEDSLLLVSSDLSHFFSAEIANHMDCQIINCLDKLDNELLWQKASGQECAACGLGGISTLILLAKHYNWRVKQLNYSHSGLKNNDLNNVVGYLSSVFY